MTARRRHAAPLVLALATLAAAVPAAAQDIRSGSSSTAQDPTTGCAPRVWPREARRYEIEGRTTLLFRIAPDGSVVDAAVARSSGWTILDAASLANLRTCRFHPRLATGANDAAQPVQYNWALDDEPVALPVQVPGSCPAAGRFAGFAPRDPAGTDSKGVRVRMLVNGKGEPYRIQAEAGRFAAADVEQAVRFADTCRFGFNEGASLHRTDTMFGKVLFK